MKPIKGMGAGRARWLAVFVVLLCASCAAPVLAESPKIGVGSAKVAEAPAGAAEVPTLPDEEAPPPTETELPAQGPIAEEVEAVESKEAAQEEWLDSSEAIRQREESRTAFDDLTAADAEAVLGSVFEEALKQLGGDPARALSDMQIEEVVSENGALVADGEGGMELVESPIPIRSQVPGEEGKAVDLDLKEIEGGFESKSPATDIKLPGSLGGQVEVGEELAFAALPGNTEVGATRFGDKDLFYPNTDTDTDTFIAPLARSVEVFQQLRSPKSPEQFRYGLTLPQETTLRSDGQGGAEAVNPKGERVASVSPPFATDAQGTEVPVSMAIEGDSVVVEITHRSMDVAYPLLLDPELVNDAWYWENTNVGLNYWSWKETADYQDGLWCTLACWGHGLYARSRGENHWYGANTYGQWIYTAPNSTAHISAATFWTIKGESYNCLTNQPHGYVGIFNVNSGTYNSLGVYSPPSGYAPNFQTGGVGGSGTRLAVVGIGTGSSPSQLACGHDFYVAGALLNQDDPEAPSVSASGMPGGWISDETPAFTITAHGSDPGLGVKKISYTRDGVSEGGEDSLNCSGTAGNRCPVNHTRYFNISALSFDEGHKTAKVTVEDALGKTSNHTWQTYVDRTKPDITLSGQLAVITEEDEGEQQGNKEVEELSLPVYNLNIKATDVGTEQDANHKKRSGVREIEVLLDGVKKQEWTQPCSDSCSMEKTYPLKLNNLSADEHVLKVIATDGVQKKRERTIEFEYIPATGMKDEYVMHYFPLDDGEGNEAEEENPARPELAVNVMNGNLVYREQDVDVEGYSVDLEVERYYNSLLPEQENTEWGDGWTLAQTPDLMPEEPEGPGPPDEAMMVRSSGAVEGAIELPTATNEEVFDPELQAVVTKEPGGGYEIADESGETGTAIAFDEEGTVDELRTEGLANVEYDYDAGELAEIEVDDPASTDITPEEAAELAEIESTPSAFKYAFGLQGSADGQFKVATDVAIDPTDSTIWVADDENDRIQHFSAEGAYIGKFSSCQDPGAVDVDLQGDIYVACSSIGKVQKYDDEGTALKQIAGPGTGNGQVRLPLDLALDPEGNLYIADTENARVQKFDAAGAFVKAFPVGGRPWGVDVGPDGRVWTAEAPERRVSVFDPQGSLLFRFGSQGTGHSQFERPVDVEVDDAGFAWVTDAVNNRVQVFDSEGGYVAQFGEKGPEDGQLDTDWWLRLAVGPTGDVWVTDQGNSRLHKWINAAYLSSFKYAFGLQGSADGQFKVATDVAIDPTDSTIWVADDENDRIQHFSAEGAYIGKFSSCQDPGAVDVDLQGDIYVACSSIGKVQKYDDEGTALKQIAGPGTGNGQVRLPLDLALDPEGNLYIVDTENARVQKFDAAGAFVKAMPVGESGRPWGLDIAPDGSIWTAEPSQHRVSVFDAQGDVLFRFGSRGAGRGQFERPVDVEVDESGFAYVTDAVNNRVQVFDSEGGYVAQFGEKGTGNGQLNTDWWLRLAVGSSGDIWVADQGNSRLHRWRSAGRLRPGYGSKVQDDPEVEIESPAGLVASVEGEEAGELSYEHDGDLLTSVAGPDGETEYEYDGQGRMTRVELANETWAEIEYGSTDGRVKKVIVDPAGAEPEKTTEFSYVDSPQRSTTVILPNDPKITYEIGEDGSIFKWKNAKAPPEFEDFAGTLVDVENLETTKPINVGTYELKVIAYAEEGMESVQIYANGNQLISEKYCPAEQLCKKLPDEWVLETRNHAPGILNVEVVIEDSFEQVASKRFWVNLPYTPPDPPGKPTKPRYADVLKFREEHGLDLDLDPIQDEMEINDRVFDTINDWVRGNPVARASWERWGAPLRMPEVAELEWRLAYWNQVSEIIPGWANANAASSFAGFYLDERAGGKITVGFTGEQASASLAAMESALAPIVGPDRIVAFPIAPKHTLTYLESLRANVASVAGGFPSGLIRSVAVEVETNAVRVGASGVAQAKSLLAASFGVQAPILVEQELLGPVRKAGRYRKSGMVRAGDEIMMPYPIEEPGEEVEFGPCTAGFGAFERGKKPASGESVLRGFVLTAAHCVEREKEVWRRGYDGEPKNGWDQIGEVRRRGWSVPYDGNMETDASAIRLTSTSILPRRIYQDDQSGIVDVHSIWTPTVGTRLCFTGRTSNKKRCGPVIAPEEEAFGFEEEGSESKSICIGEFAWGGDSGGPVWVEGTGVAVGLVSYGPVDPKEPGGKQSIKEELESEFGEPVDPEELQDAIEEIEENPWFCMTILKASPGENPQGTVFGDPNLAPLHLVTATNAKG